MRLGWGPWAAVAVATPSAQQQQTPPDGGT